MQVKKAAKSFMLDFLILTVITVFLGIVCMFNDWYEDNYVTIVPGEIVTESQYLADTHAFAFEDSGSLNYSDNVVSVTGSYLVINTEKRASELIDSLIVKILDRDRNTIDTVTLKSNKLHTINGYTNKLSNAKYVAFSFNDVTVTCDLGVSIYM